MSGQGVRLALVADLSQLERDRADRLRGLDALTEHLTHDEADQFRAFLLGALCAAVSQVEWERALGNAMEWSNTWLRTTQEAGDKREPGEPRS